MTAEGPAARRAAHESIPPDARLKQLLFSAELDLIERLKGECQTLNDRVGDDTALRASVNDVIVEVLRDAGIRDHERMAGVLAPLVLASLREEIRNSTDMMVDALYPITGRLVTAAVSNAFRDLVDRLNAQLDRTLSFERWVIKVQSMATGVSEAELLLRKHPPFRVDSMMVIHRPTGLLITRVPEQEGSAEESGADSDVVGGMLTAIMAFTRDAFGAEEPGELRTLAVGDAELLIRTSPAVILAVRTNGPLPAGFETRLEAAFVDVLDTWGDRLRNFDSDGDGDAAPGLAGTLNGDLQQRFETLAAEPARRPRKSPVKALAFLGVVALGLIAWGIWGVLEDRRIAANEDAARAAIDSDARLIGWPFEVRYDPETEEMRVAGLAPDADARQALSTALAAALPETVIDLQVAVPGAPADEVLSLIDGKLVATEDRITALSEELAVMTDWRGTALRAELDELAQRLAGIESLIRQPTRELAEWATQSAIFFSDDTDYRDPSAASAKLDALAALIDRTPPDLRLRVVGYADAIGTPARLEVLSLDRAQTVADALVSRGVAADRLIAVGRATERPLQPETGPDSASRRVEFEPAYLGE